MGWRGQEIKITFLHKANYDITLSVPAVQTWMTCAHTGHEVLLTAETREERKKDSFSETVLYRGSNEPLGNL